MAHDVREHDGFRAQKVEGPARVEEPVEQGVQAQGGRQGEAVAHVALAASEHGRIDRQHDRVVARRSRAFDQFFDQAAVSPRVDLEPFRPAVDRSDLFDRARAQRGEAVGDPGAFRRARHREFALRVRHPGEADRGEHERERQALAENRGLGVDLTDVREDPRAEFETREGGHVALTGAFVLGRAVDVVKAAAGDATLCECAQIVDAGAARESTFCGVELELPKAQHRAQGVPHRSVLLPCARRPADPASARATERPRPRAERSIGARRSADAALPGGHLVGGE